MSRESQLNQDQIKQSRKDTIQYINLQLSALGQPIYHDDENSVDKLCNPKFQKLTNGLIQNFREKSRLLSDHLAPADTRIQNFLNDYLAEYPKNEKFYLHCASGYRSVIAASILKARGIHNLADVAGGFNDIKQTSIDLTDYVCPTTLS